jgi:Trypsin-like peptidase domain
MSNQPNEDRLRLQKHILPILVTLPDGHVKCIGTGFISLANGRQAHLITAAHVIDEIRKLDDPYPKHHLTTPSCFLPVVYRHELQYARPQAVYFDGTAAHVATIEAALEMGKVDIALCSVRLNDNVGSAVVFPSRFALDTTPIRVGERIIAIGYSRMTTKVAQTTEKWIEWAFEAGLASHQGEVTNVYLAEHGPTGEKGPCFQVNVPFEGGTSGGPVFTWDSKGPYVRGFVMKGMVENSGSVPFALAGMIWPLMLMPVDMLNPNGSLRRNRCLLDLEEEGAIIDKGRAHAHVKYARNSSLQIVSAHWE